MSGIDAFLVFLAGFGAGLVVAWLSETTDV